MKTTNQNLPADDQTNRPALQEVTQCSSKVSTIKLGIDAHAEQYVVVRQIDGGAPQPPQRFSPEQFLQ